MTTGRVSITEAAEMLGISRQRVHTLITEGKLKAERIGTQWSIRRADVERRLRQQQK